MDIKKVIEAVNSELEKFELPAEPKELYQPVSYILSLGGKRLRPMLVLLGKYLFSNEWEDALKPSLSVEVFHNFTLMHDDIMDEAPLRRGKATVHTQWNDNTAILSGDAMMIKAYDALDDLEPVLYKKVIRLFNQTALEVCEGQQYDMNFESRNDVSVEEYLEMIRLKTAVLLGFSLQMGAILGGANDADAQKIKQFGDAIGLGFQLKDDILDVYGDAKDFGKQVGGDIISNKKTFLLITALKEANAEQRSKLEYWITRDGFSAEEKVKRVTDLYNEIGVITKAEQVMNNYFDEGFELLNSIDADTSRKEILRLFTNDILNRIK